MIQPKCSICSKDLMSNEGYKVERVDEKEIKTLVEPQVSYWAHDPRNLHVDVLETAHKECFDKVKAIHKDFDQPKQDYDICKYPTIDNNGSIALKTPEKVKNDFDNLIGKEKVALELMEKK